MTTGRNGCILLCVVAVLHHVDILTVKVAGLHHPHTTLLLCQTSAASTTCYARMRTPSSASKPSVVFTSRWTMMQMETWMWLRQMGWVDAKEQSWSGHSEHPFFFFFNWFLWNITLLHCLWLEKDKICCCGEVRNLMCLFWLLHRGLIWKESPSLFSCKSFWKLVIFKPFSWFYDENALIHPACKPRSILW